MFRTIRYPEHLPLRESRALRDSSCTLLKHEEVEEMEHDQADSLMAALLHEFPHPDMLRHSHGLGFRV